MIDVELTSLLHMGRRFFDYWHLDTSSCFVFDILAIFISFVFLYSLFFLYLKLHA